MIGYCDRNGKPIDAETYYALLGGDCRVALDEFDGQRVSTVWLGLDHNFGRGPLAIFETMIFGGEHNVDCRSYPSEGEALRGHREAVNNLHRGRAPW